MGLTNDHVTEMTQCAKKYVLIPVQIKTKQEKKSSKAKYNQFRTCVKFIRAEI